MKTTFVTVLCVFFALSSFVSVQAAETENSVTIEVGRVLHGASSGARYYGYTDGNIILPSKNGGTLSFNLWNDTVVNATSFLNYFRTEIEGQRIVIPSYSTSNQIVEEYAEFRGSWGAGGVQRVSLTIPAGVESIRFNNAQSATGIEISDLRFSESAAALPGGYSVATMRDAGPPIVEVGRILSGITSGRKYYGYSSGVIHLPHREGGFLTFRFWNDQNIGHSWTVDKLNLTVGTKKETFTQYSSSLDIEEFYKEFGGSHGAAGGGEVTIQLPEGISRVEFDNAGSTMGLEISDLSFTKGAPVLMSFREKNKATDRVLVDLGRVFTGASSGRKYYGYDFGSIILPDNKGGSLSFRLWNDHPSGTDSIANTLVMKAGAVVQSFPLTSLLRERAEIYAEDGGWGPSGGREYTLRIPDGVNVVEISRGPSQTGIELSDLWFSSALR